MARLPSLLPFAAAIALIAAPRPAPAQRNAEPVALSTLVAATRSCREASSEPSDALRQIRSQRWQPSDGGIPARLRAMLPIPIFERERVLLFFIEPAMGGPGECRITASVTGAPAWPDIVAALSADFGQQPRTSNDSTASWDLPNRSADARIDRGFVHVQFSVAVPQPRPAAPANGSSSADGVKPQAEQYPALPSIPAPARLPGVDPALAIQRAMTCREAPLVLDDARAYVLAQGWPLLPRRPTLVPSREIFYMFERDRVTLTVRPFNAQFSQCQTNARLEETTVWTDLLAVIVTALGRAPDSTQGTEARWVNVNGRTVEVNLVQRAWFNVKFMPAGAEPTPDPRALTAASTAPSSSPAEIALAATACITATASRNIDAGAIRSAGWGSMSERSGVRVFSRDGSNIRIFAAPAGQCVVDGYGERRDSFDAIRDAIRAALTARFGADAAMSTATGSPGAFSRGQGFNVGNRIGVLSSEQRDGGLSIRFTVMSMR
jgi:hypothetical protein